MSTDISRRRFLQQGSVWGTSLLISTQLARPRTAAAAAASNQPEVFTTEEWYTIEAMTACIMPTDHEPGALEANCVNFIDKALAREDAAALPLYRSGIAATNIEARGRFAKPFVALTPEERNILLSAIETGDTTSWPERNAVPPQIFFENLRLHTLIAFLADPKYGGNRNFSGWQVAGYPGAEHHMGGYSREQVEGKQDIVGVWKHGRHHR